MRRFDFAKFLEYNKKYRITSLFSVPPIYLLIAKSPLVIDQFDTLRHAVSGAAPLGKELQLAVQAKLGRGRTGLNQTWGLSETTGSITAMPRDRSDETGSVACLVANNYARIVDDDHKDVEPGQPGEIWVRGPVVTKGYYNNDEINKEAFVDGWFCTGDIGIFKNGLFYIVDRKKVCSGHTPGEGGFSQLASPLLSVNQAYLLTHENRRNLSNTKACRLLQPS